MCFYLHYSKKTEGFSSFFYKSHRLLKITLFRLGERPDRLSPNVEAVNGYPRGIRYDDDIMKVGSVFNENRTDIKELG